MKKWLIRTSLFQIIGPVTTADLLQRMKDGSLCSDDEICSGNGYWFFIKEKELVDKYVYRGEEQSFNIVSEYAHEKIIETTPRDNGDKNDLTGRRNISRVWIFSSMIVVIILIAMILSSVFR